MSSEFLIELIDKWYKHVDLYISFLRNVDNLVFNSLIRRLIPSIEISEIPIFTTVDEFISYWVANNGRVDWDGLSRHPLISEKTYLKWTEEGKPLRLFYHPNISVNSYLRISSKGEIDLNSLGFDETVPEKKVLEFFKKGKISPELFFSYPTITERIYLKWVEEGKPVIWNLVCGHPNISEETFLKWVEQGKPVDWYELSSHPNISRETFLKWVEEGKPLDWYLLGKNPIICDQDALKWILEGKVEIQSFLEGISSNHNISEKVYLECGQQNFLNWSEISKHPKISVETFLKWIKQNKPLDWTGLSNNLNIPEDIYSRWIEEGKPLNWYYLSQHPNCSVNFYKKHIDKFDWFAFMIGQASKK